MGPGHLALDVCLWGPGCCFESCSKGSRALFTCINVLVLGCSPWSLLFLGGWPAGVDKYSPTSSLCIGGRSDFLSCVGPKSHRATPKELGSLSSSIRWRASLGMKLSLLLLQWSCDCSAGLVWLLSFSSVVTAPSPQGFSHPGPSAVWQRSISSGQWGARALFLPGERALGMVMRNNTPSIRQ